jgi:hypothetical protein
VPTPTYLTGFEWPGVTTIVGTGGGLVASVSGAPAVEAGSARSGSYGMRCNAAGAAVLINVTVTAAATLVVRFYLRQAANPSADSTLCSIGSGGNSASLVVTSGGVIQARATGGTTRSGPTLTNGQWYLVEARFSGLGGTAWTVDWQIDSVDQTQCVGSTSGASTDTTLAFGVISAVTWDISIDDLIVSETSGDYPIGAGSVVGIAAAGAGEHQGITLSQWQYTDDFASFTNFASSTETDSATRIDDLTAGTDGIRLNGGASGQAGNARWSFADPSPDPGRVPNGVRGIAVHQDASSGTNNVTERILLAAATANIFSGNPAAAWEYKAAMFALDPGGGAWSAQDIRDLKLEIDSTDTNPAVWVGGVIIEIDYPGIVASVGQAAETDTALALARLKARAAGQAAETDAAQTLSHAKAMVAAAAAETDAALALTGVKAQPVTVAQETDAALNIIRPGQTLPVTGAAETETAGALIRVKALVIGVAADAGAAQAMVAGKAAAVVAAEESDAAGVVSKTLGLVAVTETDAAQALAAAKQLAAAVAAETDTAGTIAAAKATLAAAAVETNTASPVVAEKTLSIATATETDAAQDVTAPARIATAEETDTAAAVTGAKTQAAATATDTNASEPVVARKAAALDAATETGVAAALAASKARAAGAANETDAAPSVQPTRAYPLGTAAETDAATLLGRLKTLTLESALEAAEAEALGKLKQLALQAAIETDAAGDVTAGGSFPPITDRTTVLIVNSGITDAVGTDGATNTLAATGRVAATGSRRRSRATVSGGRTLART